MSNGSLYEYVKIIKWWIIYVYEKRFW